MERGVSCYRISPIRKNKFGQIWVETVIYTLIGLAIIGIVLGVAKPQIDKKKSEIIIQQSIESMQNIDIKVVEALSASGNQRVVDLKISEGNLFFDLDNNSIYWVLNSKFEYSEEGVPISVGLLTVTTTNSAGWKVKIERKYDLNLTFDGKSTGVKEVNSAPTPYKIVIENNGKDSDGNIIIDFRAA